MIKSTYLNLDDLLEDLRRDHLRYKIIYWPKSRTHIKKIVTIGAGNFFYNSEYRCYQQIR